MATRVAKIVVNILVLAGIVVLGVFAFIWLAPDAQSSDSSTCRPPGKGVTSTPKPPRKQREKATLTVAEGATTSFDLGLDVNSGVRTIPFVLTTPLWGRDRLQVSPGTFAPAKQDGRPLGPTAVKVWAVLDRSGNTGTAYLCISPGARERAPWGTFSGNLMFEDSRLEPTTVPITVTASYPRIHIVAVVGLAVCLLASLYVFFLRDGTDRDRVVAGGDAALRWPFGFVARYWRYTTEMVGVLTVASGLIAATAAFTAQYLNADVWSADVSEWLTFCGAIATSFVAGGTAGRLAGNRYAPPTSKPSKKSGDA